MWADVYTLPVVFIIVSCLKGALYVVSLDVSLKSLQNFYKKYYFLNNYEIKRSLVLSKERMEQNEIAVTTMYENVSFIIRLFAKIEGKRP